MGLDGWPRRLIESIDPGRAFGPDRAWLMASINVDQVIDWAIELTCAIELQAV
ncbi:MAG TPA: hypothetical protein V6D46_10985 [Coleofasciculaceae cyanobacterium]